MSTYDENIKENAFFKHLHDNHIDLLERASNEGWLICIPRCTALKAPITNEQIFEHILIPTLRTNSKEFTTLNKTTITLNGDTLKTDHHNHIHILFNETVYVNQKKFDIICIENALDNQEICLENVYRLTSVRDCMDLLWFETQGSDILPEIRKMCEEYRNDNKSMHLLTLQRLHDSVEELYMNCLLLALKSQPLHMKTLKDEHLLKNLKVAIETYMQHAFNHQLFDAVCTYRAQDDAHFNKTIRNLQDLQLKQMHDLIEYQDLIASAKYELNRINKYETILGKLHCLETTFHCLSSSQKSGRKVIITSNELIQLFAFLLIKANNVNNWLGNLLFMQHFQFNHIESDRQSFLLTTYEAAIEFIKSGKLTESIASIKIDNLLFDAIRKGNLEHIKRLLKDDDHTSNDKNAMCHPLCSCDRCEHLIETRNEFTLDYCDDRGRNCLHYACIYGHSHIVEFFLSKAHYLADYSGSYPIHLAAAYGNQSALILLLHNDDIDANMMDADGNSALHLACNNGHESCVKALLNCKRDDVNVNAINSYGMTCLHYAARWGYYNLVKILLAYGINQFLVDKRQQYAADLTSNYFIRELFNVTYNNNNNKRDLLANDDMIDKCVMSVRPKNIEQFKRTDLLLKTIETNDVPLMCFYLNIPQPKQPPPPISNNNHEGQCHPLCDCFKCTIPSAQQQQQQQQQQQRLLLLNDQLAENGRKDASLNVNICNANGWTCLHYAAHYGRLEIARLLLDVGADSNVQTSKTLYTPLHLACLRRHCDIVKELLKCGACDCDVQDANGRTCLHYACMNDDGKLVELLMGQCVNMHLKDIDGRTALQEAEERNCSNVIKLLKRTTS